MSVAAAPVGAVQPAPERDRAVLDQRARSLARPLPGDHATPLVALVLFTIGGQRYGLEARSVREVLRRPRLSMVPAGPLALIGVTNVRGEILAVADISSLLGKPAPPAGGPVVVVHGAGPALGILVEAMHDLVDVPADSVAPLPDRAGSGGATGQDPSGNLVTGAIPEAAVLSAAALLADPRMSTNEPRSGR